METAETRYAKTADGVHIAYQVVGHGQIDLVYVPGWPLASRIRVAERDGASSFYRGLATRTRLILIDRRGTGMSDRVPDDELPTIEVRMDDVRAVLDAIGSKRAALFSEYDSAAMAAVFAAAHPSRCTAIVLMTPDICSTWAPDFPWAWTSEQWDEEYRWIEQAWGTEEYVRERVAVWAPSLAGNPESARWYANLLRNAASPGAALSMARMEAETDVRRVLPTIQVPALVIRRRDDPFFTPEEIRFVAGILPGARYSEVPGTDSLPWVGEQGAILIAVADFLASVRDEEAEFDRILATVLFTDIVDSTQRQRSSAIARWQDLLEQHHGRPRRARPLPRREIDTAGDGFFATFDGPARGVRCATRSSRPSARSGSRSAPACTRARSSRSATRSAGSRCTSAPGSEPLPVPPRSSSRRR